MRILAELVNYRVPSNSARDWFDPYILLFSMVMLFIMAVGLLLTDIAERFTDPSTAWSKAEIVHDFKDRMYMVYTTVPFYLSEVRNK